MKTLCFILLVSLIGCKKATKKVKHPRPLASQTLQEHFPLLPLLEQSLWQQLLAAEKDKAQGKIKNITAELKQLHPFKNAKTHTTLGGIIFDKSSRQVTIPATVDYPPKGDDRHPQELELILCSNAGRVHETLFTTRVNPLHLEVLLHLAGFKKNTPQTSKFQLQVSLADGSIIPIRQLLQTSNKEALSNKKIVWEFSGSDFTGGLYSPEQTGDLIICWHVHDSVLRIADDEIGSGDTKILPVEHIKLTPNLAVKLVLIPLE